MKIVRASQASPQGKPGRPYALAQILLERHLAPYILLECDHFTTREAVEFYSLWRPKRGMYYCETCTKWRQPMASPTPEPLPEDPAKLF